MGRQLLGSALALALIATACTGETASTTTEPPPPETSTSTQATTTTTTQPPTTTTFVIPYAALDVEIAADSGVSKAVEDFYAWFGDRTLPEPAVPVGLIEHLSDVYPTTGSASFTGELYTAEIAEIGTAGVVIVNDEDTILIVDDAEEEGDEDTGWRVVGAWLSQYDADPWFGNPIRHVFVMGTDARPGEFQKHLRADSLHIVSSNIVEGSGGLLGIPRDTRVESSVGIDKFTNINALVFTEACGRVSSDADCEERDAGQEEMVEIAAGFSGLPLEGWIVTGFLGFTQLVNAFGGVEIDVPISMAEPFSEAYLSAGLQTLYGSDALAFSRNRKQFGEVGDFLRSLHQGMVIYSAMEKVLEQDITAAPEFLSVMMQFTWTGLSLEDLFTLAAGAFLLDPTQVGNEVVPATGGLSGGVYYATFTEDAEALFRDLDDGSLTPGESWLTYIYGE